MESNALIKPDSEALRKAFKMWAGATTDASSRRRKDLLRDKQKAVREFFEFVGKSPMHVAPEDVRDWQDHLEGQGLSPASVYGMVSRVSSFYRWAREDSQLASFLTFNPVDLARPKPPKMYSSESVKSLNDEELTSLIEVVKSKADTGDIVGLRDYALFLHFILTGRRRAEVINLRWGNIQFTNGGMMVTYRIKGGKVRTWNVKHPAVKESMIAYLDASGRTETIKEEDPIWTRHDRAGNPGEQVTSHAIAKNFKGYAEEAGIKGFHLHTFRHTFARLGGEEGGSLAVVQEALGQSSPEVTRIYLQEVGINRDVLSSKIGERLGLTT